MGRGCRHAATRVEVRTHSITPRAPAPPTAPPAFPPARLQFVSTPKTATPRTSRRAVASLIALKHTLETLPSVAAPLGGAANPLLAAIRDNLSSPSLGALRTLIDAVLTEDTTWARSPVAARQQECFAVRPGIDGGWRGDVEERCAAGHALRVSFTAPFSPRLHTHHASRRSGSLDAVRTVYTGVIRDIHELAEGYRGEWATVSGRPRASLVATEWWWAACASELTQTLGYHPLTSFAAVAAAQLHDRARVPLGAAAGGRGRGESTERRAVEAARVLVPTPPSHAQARPAPSAPRLPPAGCVARRRGGAARALQVLPRLLHGRTAQPERPVRATADALEDGWTDASGRGFATSTHPLHRPPTAASSASASLRSASESLFNVHVLTSGVLASTVAGVRDGIGSLFKARAVCGV